MKKKWDQTSLHRFIPIFQRKMRFLATHGDNRSCVRTKQWNVQDNAQVLPSTVTQWMMWVCLTTSSGVNQTQCKQMVLHRPASLLNFKRTITHEGTHATTTTHKCTPERRQVHMPSSWRTARLWDSCSLTGV